jgi:hypothetical protein
MLPPLERIMTGSPGDCKYFETSNPASLKAGTEARPTINMRVGEGGCGGRGCPSPHQP